MLNLIVTALAAPALAAAAPASSQELNVTITLPVADLDLSKARDVETMNARLLRLAREACEVRDPLGRAAPRTDWACVRQAQADAQRQLAAATGTVRLSVGN